MKKEFCSKCNHCKGMEVVRLRKQGLGYYKIAKIMELKSPTSVVQFLKSYAPELLGYSDKYVENILTKRISLC